MGHEDGHGHAHGHGGVSAVADRRWLGIALVLIVGFMAVEVVVGVAAHSLALISDAGHMLTDAASIALALVAIRVAARPAVGLYTYGFKRVEILSAQANGITLLLLAVWFVYESVRRLIEPPAVSGPLVLITALVGIAVNIAAAWSISGPTAPASTLREHSSTSSTICMRLSGRRSLVRWCGPRGVCPGGMRSPRCWWRC